MALPIFQRTVVNDSGDVISGAEVTVVDEATGLNATIYNDRAGTTTETNPFFTAGDGLAQFYADPGEYRITASGVSGTVTWRYVVLSGQASLNDVVPIEEGGTGANNLADAKSNLGIDAIESDISSIESDIARGIVGNYEEILAYGNYTSGIYTYPNSHLQDDYEMILFICAVGSGNAVSNMSLATRNFISAAPTNWSSQTRLSSPTTTEQVTCSHSSNSQFLLSTINNGVLKQVIGYLKDGV